MKTGRGLLTIMLIGLCAFPAVAPSEETKGVIQETPEARDARMQWWREARFGMFIHWGVYSVPAGIHKDKAVGGLGEWIMGNGRIPIPEYEEYAKQFNPVKFDADAWVKIAKKAGVKYIVITSKHHDGFCLWDSKVSDYDIKDVTPFKRDVLKELSVACKREGIRLCFYYSIMDWHHPAARQASFPKYRDEYMIPQLNELLSGDYGDVGVLWFDGEWIGEWTAEYGRELEKHLRGIQSKLIVNNRVGKRGRSPGDFGTPEQKIPATGTPGCDWETCMTINDTWGYKSNDENWKPAKQLLRMLIDIASKGGNFLLNVGPTAEGLIPQPSVERLKSIGEWLDVNGESIYGTTASAFDRPPWGRYTVKPGKIFAHVFDWPKEGRIEIAAPDLKTSKAYLLVDNQRTGLKTEKTDSGWLISLPASAPDPIASVIVIENEKTE